MQHDATNFSLASFLHLPRKFLTLASRATNFEESYLLVDGLLNNLIRQVEDKIKESSNTTPNQPEEQAPFKHPKKNSLISLA